MKQFSRSLNRVLASLGMGFALVTLPSVARAQEPCDPTMLICENDTIPPSVRIAPKSQKFTSLTSIPIVIEFCDNNAHDALAHQILENGVEVSAQFTETTDSYPLPPWCPGKYGRFERQQSVTPGVHSYGAFVSDDAGNSASASASYEYHIVSVQPKASLVRHGAGFPFSERYWVYNTSGTSYGFNLTTTCTNGPTSCQIVAPLTRTIGAHDSTQVIVNYTAGAIGTRGALSLKATYAADATESSTGTYTVVADAPVYGVAVTPKGDSARAAASLSATQVFVVRSTANVTSTYNLAGTCTSGMSCSASIAPVTIGPGDSATVSVSYTAGAAGATGRVQLKASYQPNVAVKDSGWVNVLSTDARKPWVRADSLSAGAVIARALCLNVAAGADGGYECGDLRLAHALPVVTTLNKARVPTLLYNSQHAEPLPLVSANVTRVAGGQLPDSVIATLKIDTLTIRSAYPGAEWQNDATRSRRVTVAVPARAKGLKTGVYSYMLEVANKFGATTLADTARGQLVIVDRSQSSFGSGWWLAGLEQLPAMWPTTGTFAKDTILWVGGDGSAAVYRRDRSVSGRAVWRATPLDRPDSLTRDSSSAGVRYTRYLPHGVRVQFDTLGQHIATINRLQHSTQFRYTAGKLTAIDLPPFSGSTPAFTYTLAYTSGMLDSVIAPGLAGQPRAVKLVIDASTKRVTSIRDADLTLVRFGYQGATGRVALRINRKGDSTSYAYDAGGKVQEARVQTGTNLSGTSTTAPIVTGFRSSESMGIVGAASPNSISEPLVATKFDGPRNDVGDTTSFWLDRFGAPYRILDAIGRETRIWREQAGLPVLATRVRDAAGRVSSATYDGHGNVLTTVDSSTYVDSASTRMYAVTRYGWQPKYDMVTLIVPPGRDSVVIAYDTTNGNRLWQKDATGDTSRVTFTYDPVYGQVLTAKTKLSPAASFDYDALRNTSTVTSPGGKVSTSLRDGLGRVFKTTSPIDATHTDSSRTWYDVAGQDTLSAHYGPAMSATNSELFLSSDTPAQVVWVRQRYDAEGAIDSVSRWSAPDTAHIGILTTRFRYDHAGRKIAEIAPEGHADSLALDPAGNVVTSYRRSPSTTSAGVSVITMQYDVLNRLKQRQFSNAEINPVFFQGFGHTFPNYPASSSGGLEQFAYDRAGNMVSAVNAVSTIGRVFNPNGSVAEDTLAIADYDGVFRGNHTFVQQYTYDIAGRRKTHVTPGLTATYQYDVAGRLKTIGSAASGDFTYHYDAEGKQDTLWYPTGVIESRRYDVDANLFKRKLWHGSTIIHDDSLLYDSRGKLTEAFAGEVQAAYAYSGLGALAFSARYNSRTMDRLNQVSVTDALGNRVVQRSAGDSTVYHYWNAAAGTASGRLAWTFGANAVDTTVYYSDGSAFWYSKQANPVTMERAVYLYYGDGNLRALDRRVCKPSMQTGACTPGSPTDADAAHLHASFEEYWYDALGRRIMVRSRSDYFCAGGDCGSSLDRVYWDGDQIVREDRVPGATGDSLKLERPYEASDDISNKHYGIVDYLHGPGIDQPLAIVRNIWGVAIVPYTNFSGEFDQASVGGCNDFDQPAYGECQPIDWPAQRYDPFGKDVPAISSYWRAWVGSLARSGKDESGLMYRRNRYYDPTTARFTQEDPIGLAGGLNSYGYANGDPVSYSDPFGLKPCCDGITDAGESLEAAPNPALRAAGRAMIIAGAAIAAASAVKDKLDDFKFVTYTRTNAATGQVYSGRTSGFGDPNALVQARAAGHPERLAGFGPAVLDRVGDGNVAGYYAIRGREQQLIDANGGAKSDGGTSANLIRGVSKLNPMASYFDAMATGTFGPPPPPRNP